MKIAIVAGSLLLLLAVARPSAAQPVTTAPPPTTAPAPVGAPLSEDLALTLSLGGIIGSMAAGAGGVYLVSRLDFWGIPLGGAGLLGVTLAPSFGHWYAGKAFTLGLGVRAAGALIVVIGVGRALDRGWLVADSETASPNLDETRLLAVLGAVLITAGMIPDIASVRGRVRRRNQERGFALAPLAAPRAAGLALGGRF